jgi:hypothetical protein
MVCVSKTDEKSTPDLNLVVHRTVHQLLEREEERPGWYGDPLDTAWVGIALQQHEGYRDRVSRVADELEEWYRATEISHEFEVAALGLIGKFFGDYERGRPIYTDIEEQFFSKLEEERERREAFRDVHSDPQLQFFASHVYLYCALVGIEAYEQLYQHRSFLYGEVESHRQKRWTEYERMAFIETVALRVKEYDVRECRSVLKEMRTVDLEELREDEIIPLTWFFQEHQGPILDSLPDEKFAHQLVDEIRQNLWQRLYDELPFQLYLSGEIEYKFAPNVRQLAQLDQLLGRLENSIRVFSERQLEKHDQAVAEEKNKRVRVNRRRSRIGFVVGTFFLGFISADAIVAHPPTSTAIGAQSLVQVIMVIFMMILQWQLEGLSRDYSLTEKYEAIGDFVNTIEEGNWPAWVLRAVFGGIGWVAVGYGWSEIKAFFQLF